MMHRRAFIERTALGLIGLGLTRCATHDVKPLQAGLSLPFLTPVDDYFVKNGAQGSIAGWHMPAPDATSWRLTVDGLVDSPLTLTLADLEAESAHAIEVLKTMQCVVDANAGQGLVGTAVWRGVPLRRFLERAGLQRGAARRLHVFGADGFRNNMPLDRIPDANAPAGLEERVEPLLVTHMNGAPLTREHGAPVRLLVSDGFGFASVKWIERITATDDDSAFGTYQDTGFTDDLTSPVFSRITSPTDNLSVPAGEATLLGFATSGRAGVEGVEVRVDGGPWQLARVVTPDEILAQHPELRSVEQFKAPERFPYPFRAVWALWAFTFDARPGRYRIEARATDRAGNTQPDRDLEISDGVNATAAIRLEVF